ncbi:hypothetical protein L3Y34_009181 [Caenorhabditis briggsae]|uniref:Uncharacterized protein n=1 Tax=Caenorhabditis briggsae TaxID=6238 RepID=A0AAE9A7R3_CAEBR|nr:hypothetical protein L3Y34_009181 [Caenorhabditis briggsae]
MFLVQNILAIISLITNGLLIFLIITKSPKTMGSYKYLMIFMSSFEILYALIDLLIHPKVFTMNTIFLTAISAERSLLPLHISYPLMLIWGGSFGIALASFGIHFVYRYLTVTGNKAWTTGYSIVFWISIPVLSGFFFAFAIDFFLETQ